MYRVQVLNTNKEIVAMSSGPLNPAKDNDMLFIGSRTNLLVYGKSHTHCLYRDNNQYYDYDYDCRRGDQLRHF